jgi:hypothetical protein
MQLHRIPADLSLREVIAMPWPSENEPEDKLHEALHVMEETRSRDEVIATLSQELRRLQVLKRLRQQQKLLPAPAAPAAAGADIEALSEALSFYAEQDNYKAGAARKSAVARDGGKRARTALAALDRESGETEGSK